MEAADDQWDPCFDEDPGERSEIGVEDARRDQLDNRATRRGGRGPEECQPVVVIHGPMMTGTGESPDRMRSWPDPHERSQPRSIWPLRRSRSSRLRRIDGRT